MRTADARGFECLRLLASALLACAAAACGPQVDSGRALTANGPASQPSSKEARDVIPGANSPRPPAALEAQHITPPNRASCGEIRLCGADRPDLTGVFLHFDSPAAATLEERLLLSAWLGEVVRGVFTNATRSSAACSGGLLCLRLPTVPSTQEFDSLVAALRHPSAAAYYRARAAGLDSIERAHAQSEQHVVSWAVAEALGDTSLVTRLDRAKQFTKSQLEERWLEFLHAGLVTVAGTGAASAVQELRTSCEAPAPSPSRHAPPAAENRTPAQHHRKASPPSQLVVVDSDAPAMLTFALLPSSAPNAEAVALGARLLAERTAPEQSALSHRAPRWRGSPGMAAWAIPITPEDAYALVVKLRAEYQQLISTSGAPTQAEVEAASPTPEGSCLDQRCSGSLNNSPLSAAEVQSMLLRSELGIALSGHFDALAQSLRESGFKGRILTVNSDGVKQASPPQQKP